MRASTSLDQSPWESYWQICQNAMECATPPDFFLWRMGSACSALPCPGDTADSFSARCPVMGAPSCCSSRPRAAKATPSSGATLSLAFRAAPPEVLPSVEAPALTDEDVEPSWPEGWGEGLADEPEQDRVPLLRNIDSRPDDDREKRTRKQSFEAAERKPLQSSEVQRVAQEPPREAEAAVGAARLSYSKRTNSLPQNEGEQRGETMKGNAEAGEPNPPMNEEACVGSREQPRLWGFSALLQLFGYMADSGQHGAPCFAASDLRGFVAVPILLDLHRICTLQHLKVCDERWLHPAALDNDVRTGGPRPFASAPMHALEAAEHEPPHFVGFGPLVSSGHRGVHFAAVEVPMAASHGPPLFGGGALNELLDDAFPPAEQPIVGVTPMCVEPCIHEPDAPSPPPHKRQTVYAGKSSGRDNDPRGPASLLAHFQLHPPLGVSPASGLGLVEDEWEEEAIALSRRPRQQLAVQSQAALEEADDAASRPRPAQAMKQSQSNAVSSSSPPFGTAPRLRTASAGVVRNRPVAAPEWNSLPPSAETRLAASTAQSEDTAVAGDVWLGAGATGRHSGPSIGGETRPLDAEARPRVAASEAPVRRQSVTSTSQEDRARDEHPGAAVTLRVNQALADPRADATTSLGDRAADDPRGAASTLIDVRAVVEPGPALAESRAEAGDTESEAAAPQEECAETARLARQRALRLQIERRAAQRRSAGQTDAGGQLGEAEQKVSVPSGPSAGKLVRSSTPEAGTGSASPLPSEVAPADTTDGSEVSAMQSKVSVTGSLISIASEAWSASSVPAVGTPTSADVSRRSSSQPRGPDSLRAVVLGGFSCRALNTLFVERPSKQYRLNGRESYWSEKADYFIFYNAAMRTWAVEKAKRLSHVQCGQSNGVAHGPDGYDIWCKSLREGWYEYDKEAFAWTHHGSAGVTRRGRAKPSRLKTPHE